MRLGEVPKSCSDVTNVMFSCFGCPMFADRHLDACARHEAVTFMSILRGDVESQVGECQLSVSVRTKRSR